MRVHHSKCPRHLGHVPREQLLEGTDNSVGKRQEWGCNPKAERAGQPWGTTRERTNGNKVDFSQRWLFLGLVKYLTPTYANTLVFNIRK